MIVQYYSSPLSWINIGAFGAPNASWEHINVTVTGLHHRPAGTFSSTSGIECFVPCVVAYLLYAFTNPGSYPRFLVWSSAILTIIAIPISVSRTVWFVTAAVIVWTVLLGLGSVKYVIRLIRIGIVLLLAIVVISQTPVFRDALYSATYRWTTAGEGDTKDVIKLRVWDPFLAGFGAMTAGGMLGRGIGSGSNVAAVIQTGHMGFPVAEWEWPRIILECGPLGGLIFLGFRLGLCVYIMIVTSRAFPEQSALGCSLAAAAIPTILTKFVEQPTSLGFMAWGGGMCLSAARYHYARRRLVVTLAVESDAR